MTRRSRMALWRGARLVPMVAIALACARRAPVDVEAARRLEGDWALTLTVDPSPGPALPAEIRGTVALLVNRSAVRVPDFPGAPLAVGVHDLTLGALAPGGEGSRVPAVVATLVGDSAVVVIGPNGTRPIRMRGVAHGDSIAGRWSATQRAGPGFSGAFTLVRR